MSSTDGTVAPDATTPATVAAQAEARRWRLVARLAETLADQVGWESFARTSAAILADELRDVAMVVVVSPPGHDDPVAAVAHRDPAKAPIADMLLRDARPDDLRALVADVVRAGRSATTGAPTISSGTYGRDYQLYRSAVGGLASSVRAPLRRGAETFGSISCSRDAGSEPYSAADLAAFAAAAETMSLIYDAARARAATVAAHRRWTAAFDAASIGMATLDPTGRVTAMNPVGRAILGRDATEVAGRLWEGFSHPDDAPEDRAALARILAGESTGTQRTKRVLRPDGEERLVRVAKLLVRDLNGHPEAFHVYFNDMTAQYAAEAEAERFRALVHSSNDFMGMADLDGTHVFVNAAGRANIHFPDTVDAASTTLTDFVVDEPGSPGLEEILATVHRTGSWEGQANLRDWRDGSAIPVWASTFLLRDIRDGEPIAVATIRRDMRTQLADQHRLETVAHQRRELLSELLTAEQNERHRIADDLHDESVQLLAAAQLRLQLLTAHLKQNDVEAARRSVSDVTELVVGSLRQLRSILADLHPPVGDGAALSDTIRNSAQQFFDDSGVEVTVEGTVTDMGTEVAAVFQRGAREALSNAFRHARATHVAVRLRDDADAWVVVVDDDGVGMPAAIAPRAGHLGLRGMVSRIEALGGTCTIGPRPGGGTRVQFLAPRTGSA